MILTIGFAGFLVLLLTGMFLVELYLHKGNVKKAKEGMNEPLIKSIALIGPLLLVCLIIDLILL